MFFLNENLENSINLFEADLKLIADKHNLSINQLYKQFSYIAKGNTISYHIFDNANSDITDDCVALFRTYFPKVKN